MRKFRYYTSMLFTVPAAAIIMLGVLLIGLGGAVAGFGFLRPMNVLLDELMDALKYTKVRLQVGKHK